VWPLRRPPLSIASRSIVRQSVKSALGSRRGVTASRCTRGGYARPLSATTSAHESPASVARNSLARLGQSKLRRLHAVAVSDLSSCYIVVFRGGTFGHAMRCFGLRPAVNSPSTDQQTCKSARKSWGCEKRSTASAPCLEIPRNTSC